MERSDLPDDDAAHAGAYPPAPLPPHERTWRHPSELGTATWVHTEPPLTIGRGLLLTTGAIGGLLAIAVLWAMLPSAGRGGSVAPAVITSAANAASRPVPTVLFEAFASTTVDFPASGRQPTTVDAAPADPTSTTAVEQTRPTVSPGSIAGAEADPVAIGISDSLAITTAQAVGDRQWITMTGADGHRHRLTVVKVDKELGVAVLSVDSASMPTSYGIGPAVADGETVTVLGSEHTSATVSIDDDGHIRLDRWGASLSEGTPVVNAAGQLIGLCSRRGSGPELVSVSDVAAMLPPPKPATPPVAWLGIDVVGPAAPLVVRAIDAASPAIASGLVVGDTITAIDGAAVGDLDQLKSVIATHAPDEVVMLTILRSDQTIVDVAVTLGAPPPA